MEKLYYKLNIETVRDDWSENKTLVFNNIKDLKGYKEEHEKNHISVDKIKRIYYSEEIIEENRVKELLTVEQYLKLNPNVELVNKTERVHIKEMYDLSKDTDYEDTHHKADEILCDVLISKGELELVDAFRNLKKYYS